VSQELTIIPLAECPLLAPVVARWHFGEWGHFYPGGTVDGRLDHIQTRMNRDRIPMTVVALDGEEPLGAGALVEHDMGCAVDFGTRDLYLYTASAERLYEKLGWRLLSREPYMGREIGLMTWRNSCIS